MSAVDGGSSAGGAVAVGGSLTVSAGTGSATFPESVGGVLSPATCLEVSAGVVLSPEEVEPPELTLIVPPVEGELTTWILVFNEDSLAVSRAWAKAIQSKLMSWSCTALI